MSKSAGNFYTIRDLIDKGWNGNEIRLTLLSAHYRSTLDFSIKSLEQSRASIARIAEARRVCEAVDPAAPNEWSEEYRRKFSAALSDDLNVSEALAATFELTNAVLRLSTESKVTPEIAASALDFFENDFEAIFDCFPSVVEIDRVEQCEIEKIAERRIEARKKGDWEESDRLRNLLLEKYHVAVRDTPEGQMLQFLVKR